MDRLDGAVTESGGEDFVVAASPGVVADLGLDDVSPASGVNAEQVDVGPVATSANTRELPQQPCLKPKGWWGGAASRD
ncbi:MAG: hypothetical protein M3492_01955 [Actinomycetota bacterium]|nr:hypothetical protein [Actinomycetota bacterium]